MRHRGLRVLSHGVSYGVVVVRVTLEWKTAMKGEITLEGSACLLLLTDAIHELVGNDKAPDEATLVTWNVHCLLTDDRSPMEL